MCVCQHSTVLEKGECFGRTSAPAKTELWFLALQRIRYHCHCFHDSRLYAKLDSIVRLQQEWVVKGSGVD